MIAVLLITALFVFISIYFFFRAEKLQYTIISLKRDALKTQNENQVVSKAMGLMAGNTEGFARNRLQLLLNNTQDKATLDELALIKLFIDNYTVIFKACLLKKGKLHSMTKSCFANHPGDAYQDFVDSIIKKDSKIQRLWSSNNFIGFISMAEALLVKYEKSYQESLTAEGSTIELESYRAVVEY